MPPKTGTTIKLDRVRTFRFRARAWETFEQHTGRKILEGNALENMGLSEIVTLAWCGLLHEDPELTRDQVGDMLGIRELQTLPAVMLAAIESELPEAKNGQGGKKGARKKPASP